MYPFDYKQLALLAIQYLLVPLLRGIAVIAVKILKKAPDGIPKKLALAMLEAIETNAANEVDHSDLEFAKDKLSNN